MEPTRSSRSTVLYASTIFLSAFLLFQVQPLIGRLILPWFGGGSAVWTTCLLFFQTVLFAGYAYAHASEHWFRPRARTIVHLTLIVAALLTLPITPSDSWKPPDSSNPTGRILLLLAVCVGLPYFVLSSTGPLVQAWFSRTIPGRSPYRLYSLSNFGSLLALLSYPFVVEPALGGHAQSVWWTAGFVLFAILCGAACWQTTKLSRSDPRVAGAAAEANAPARKSSEPPPSWTRRLLWLMLPAFAAMLLLVTTNHVCQEMPPVPFLWVVPLSLYLLSFIIAFNHERWYRRLPYGLAALVAVYLTAGMYNAGGWGAGWLGSVHDWIWGTSASPWIPSFGYRFDIGCQFTALFALCMLCHGELVRLRPEPRYLTNFYLMISAGGALGGLSVSVVAPRVFNSFAEWKIGLVAGFVLAAGAAFVLTWPSRSGQAKSKSKWRRQSAVPRVLRLGGLVACSLALLEIASLLRNDDPTSFANLAQTRDFYGVLAVVKGYTLGRPHPFHMLYNGGIRHGVQFTDTATRRMATTYYSEKTGIGHTLKHYQAESGHGKNALRVGVIGLGVGTLASYIDGPNQTIRFYEIDPAVPHLAENYFSFLGDARQRGATVEIVVGDGRLALERELKQEPQAFDLLVLDAFSGDSIPTHLLTTEALTVYLPHLAPKGALAIHVSNRNLDLGPVTFGLAEHFDLEAARFFTPDSLNGGWPADWVILSRNQKLLATLRTSQDNSKPAAPTPPLPTWTDQRHDLLGILR